MTPTGASNPRVRVSYTKLVCRPGLELFDYLKAHDFRVFLCSGGGRDFCSGGGRDFLQDTPERTAGGNSGAPAETS
jgi:hypothetical protein